MRAAAASDDALMDVLGSNGPVRGHVVRYGKVWNDMVWYGTIWFGRVRYGGCQACLPGDVVVHIFVVDLLALGRVAHQQRLNLLRVAGHDVVHVHVVGLVGLVEGLHHAPRDTVCETLVALCVEVHAVVRRVVLGLGGGNWCAWV